MGYGAMVFLAVMTLLVGLIVWSYFPPNTPAWWNRWWGYRDNGAHTRPERNDDGQGGGGFD